MLSLGVHDQIQRLRTETKSSGALANQDTSRQHSTHGDVRSEPRWIIKDGIKLHGYFWILAATEGAAALLLSPRGPRTPVPPLSSRSRRPHSSIPRSANLRPAPTPPCDLETTVSQKAPPAGPHKGRRPRHLQLLRRGCRQRPPCPPPRIPQPEDRPLHCSRWPHSIRHPLSILLWLRQRPLGLPPPTRRSDHHLHLPLR